MATVDMLGIKKAFGPSVALEDFNLSIASGELVSDNSTNCTRSPCARAIAPMSSRTTGNSARHGAHQSAHR